MAGCPQFCSAAFQICIAQAYLVVQCCTVTMSSILGSQQTPDADLLAAHWTTEFKPERIACCVRQPAHYATENEAETVLATLLHVLAPLPRPSWCILLDARATPGQVQEPAIEAVIVRYRKLLFEGFAGAAILTRTAAGTMQVWRQAKQDGVTYLVFSDEEAAYAYLRKRLGQNTTVAREQPLLKGRRRDSKVG